MAAGLLGKALDMAFALYYLRALEPAGTATYQFLVVLATYLDTLINFGLSTVLARDLARRPAASRSAFGTVLGLRLALWLAGGLVVLVVLGPLREPAGLSADAPLAGTLFYLSLLPSLVGATASALLWSAERLDLAAAVSVATTVLRVALGSLALLLGGGLVGLALVAVVASTFSALALVALMLRAGALRPGAERFLGPTSLLREAWPLFVNQLLAGLFFRVDSLLLPGLAGQRPAGAYAAAYKVIDGVGVISSSVTLAVFPRLARDAQTGGEALARAYRVTLRVLLQAALPLTLGGALLAEPLVMLLGGRAYLPEGALALALLIWFLPLSYANGLTQYVLVALGRQRFLTGAFAVAVAFNLAANLLLIPRYGIIAAAVVTILSEVVLLVPLYGLARRLVPGVSLLREGRHAIVAALLMAPVVWWLRDSLGALPALLAGAVVYPVALWSVGGIDAEQAALLRAMLRRARPAAAAPGAH